MKRISPFFRTLILDILVLVIVFVSLVLVTRTAPTSRGFFCDDESIAYPFKTDTVTGTSLLIICLVVPLVVFLLVEIPFGKCLSHDKFDARGWSPKATRCGGHGLYHIIITFLFGFGATVLITMFGKAIVGRLRPHFIAVCQPIGSDYARCQSNPSLYIYPGSYKCNGTAAGYNIRQIIDARMSFPSGHASFSVYAMVFVILYLQARMTWRETRLLRGLLQLGAALLGCLCSVTRVTDNKHHATDVLAGAILGAAAACVVIFCTLRLMPIASIRDLKLMRKDGKQGEQINAVDCEINASADHTGSCNVRQFQEDEVADTIQLGN